MGVNLQIQQTKQNIINCINNAKLPISVICMILNEITNQAQIEQNRTLKKEEEQQQKQQQSQVITD